MSHTPAPFVYAGVVPTCCTPPRCSPQEVVVTSHRADITWLKCQNNIAAEPALLTQSQVAHGQLRRATLSRARCKESLVQSQLAQSWASLELEGLGGWGSESWAQLCKLILGGYCGEVKYNSCIGLRRSRLCELVWVSGAPGWGFDHERRGRSQTDGFLWLRSKVQKVFFCDFCSARATFHGEWLMSRIKGL